MGRPLGASNIRQVERQRERQLRRLRQQIRRLESNVTQQRPYRATPNTEGVDAGVPEQTLDSTVLDRDVLGI